jgi:glutamine cyclotransferase
LRSGLALKTWNLEILMEDQRKFILEKGGEPKYDWGNAVLNGIAYKKETDSFILAGKLWDHIYEVKLDYLSYVK